MAKKRKPNKWDFAEKLKTQKDIRLFLCDAFEKGQEDPSLMEQAIGIAARSRGMSAIARMTELNRASLYDTFSGNGDPRFRTVLKVLGALGFTLRPANKKP